MLLFQPYEEHVDQLVSDAIINSVRTRYEVFFNLIFPDSSIKNGLNGIYSVEYVLGEITARNGDAMFEVTLVIDKDRLDFQPSLSDGVGLPATINNMLENIFSTSELIPRIVQTPTNVTASDPYRSETYKSK